MVKLLCFHCSGDRFNPWLGNQQSTCWLQETGNGFPEQLNSKKRNPKITQPVPSSARKKNKIRKICVLGEWFLSHHGAPDEQKGVSPRASLLEGARCGGHLDGVLSINQGQSPPAGGRGATLMPSRINTSESSSKETGLFSSFVELQIEWICLAQSSGVCAT